MGERNIDQLYMILAVMKTDLRDKCGIMKVNLENFVYELLILL